MNIHQWADNTFFIWCGFIIWNVILHKGPSVLDNNITSNTFAPRMWHRGMETMYMTALELMTKHHKKKDKCSLWICYVFCGCLYIYMSKGSLCLKNSYWKNWKSNLQPLAIVFSLLFFFQGWSKKIYCRRLKENFPSARTRIHCFPMYHTHFQPCCLSQQQQPQVSIYPSIHPKQVGQWNQLLRELVGFLSEFL